MRIDIDTCEEILITITRNKTRSLLTAFGVFWGIFMLVALIGGGQGMQEELKSQFEGFATNSGFIAAQKTSEAYKGFRKGRWWDLEMEDVDRVRNVDGVALATPSIALWGQVAVYGDNKYDCSVKGLYPEYEQIEHQEMTYGRFINDVDIKESRKVCVIGKRVYESLFKPGEDPCGKYVRVNGIYYRVIGMCSSEGNVNIQGQASEAITLPFSTMQQTYNLGKKLHVVCFIMKPGVKVKDVQPEVERLVKAAHYIAPDDKQAVMLLNAEAMFSMMDNLMIGVRFLIWMVGLGTLFAGAIGVSNIMMVTVKERTTEIGIRRAIGARPKDILQQILSQSMVLTACKRGDEIILPRNVHRSVLNALVLCGAVPVYVNPEVDKRLGISLGMKREQVAKAIKEHPNAVAVLVNNPTYYGICSDLRAIVKMAHEAGMLCLADEAHGTHFYFGNGLPVSAMAAGADMASVSMHKSGGSLTQSSLLLIGPNVHPGYVRQIINLTQTTSGSYLLMSSLDISRRNLALRGRQVFHQVADMAEYAREEINAVGGYYAFGKELCNGDSVFDFDTTKLSVHTLDIGLAGIEVYDILRDEYDIQIEFGDIGNILAYLSIGDRPQEIERLVSALAEIKRRYHTDGTGLLSQEYIDPVVAASPQEAFYAPKKSLPLRETEGMVCSEFVMCYPPGIPILAPGERITKEILNYIEYAKAKGCSMTGPEDPDILHLNVLA